MSKTTNSTAEWAIGHSL